MSATTSTTGTSSRLSGINKTGLVIAGLLGVTDIFAVLVPASEEAEAGPPFAILLLDSILGVITVVAVVWAFRAVAKRGAQRTVAAARIISAITALPAFFVPVPPVVKLFTGVFVLLTVAVVVMVLLPSRRDVTR